MTTKCGRVFTFGRTFIEINDKVVTEFLFIYLLIMYNKKYNHDYIIKLTKMKLVNNNNNKLKIVNFKRIYHYYVDIVFLYNWLRFR